MHNRHQPESRENFQATAINQVLSDLKIIYAHCTDSLERISQLACQHQRLLSRYQASSTRNWCQKPGGTGYCSEYSRCVIQIVRLYAQSKYANPTMVNHFIHRYLKILF